MKFLQDVEILKNNIYHKGLQETKPYENNDQNDAIEINDRYTQYVFNHYVVQLFSLQQLHRRFLCSKVVLQRTENNKNEYIQKHGERILCRQYDQCFDGVDR